MKVGVVGLGYVGVTLAIYASEHFVVVGYDTDLSKISALNTSKSYIEGISDLQISERIKSGNFFATSDSKYLNDCQVIIIAVPTPLSEKREPDLYFIESACKVIANEVKHKVLIINESTSYPGTLRNFIKPVIEKNQDSQIEHLYAVSPERVDPGRSDFSQENTARLIGGLSDEAVEETYKFYSKFCNSIIKVSSAEVAECAKLFENTFRQVNIALVNEFAQYTSQLRVNIFEILSAADTKPYGFMKFTPSAGVGGHCIPVDPTFLAHSAEQIGVPATLIRNANRINLDMPRFIVDYVESEFGVELNGRKVQVIGVAYKPNVKDVRESPAELVVEHLRNKGALVTWHDEVVKSWKGEFSSPLGGADIAIVVTKHDSLSVEEILKSAAFVFDSTGKVPGANSF